MLSELTIQNLALIEKLTLNFHKGFSTLTGETGAGKSILLDALGLALGERADSALVRYDTKRADISARFDLSNLAHVQNWLEEQELDEDNSCFLRRTLTAEGRSKAYINGIPVSLNQLKTLSSMLIDIHGQHEHQSLLNPIKQLELLDAFAAHSSLLDSCRQHYQNWQKSKRLLTKLEAEQDDYQNRLELLHFQQQEFADLAPQNKEFEQLEQEQNTLSHASEIKHNGEQAYQLLEEENGASDIINRSISCLEQICEYEPKFSAPLQQLNSALIEVQEAASEIQSLSENVELDPQQLNQVEERLSELFAAAKKYQVEPAELLQKQQQIEQQLDELEHSSESVDELKAAVELQQEQFFDAAEKLGESRRKAAKKLSKEITVGMQQLGMANGKFSVDISQAKTPSSAGIDSCMFQVSANKGQPLQSMAKVASGGELSRISLAIQVATAEVAQLPTLIFDEVDVGIGGGIAEVVGEKMRQLGEHKQILSITHLAQVAAHGNQHLRISKHDKKSVTHTQVEVLQPKERIGELARMLGGMTITEQTEKMAQEMWQQAQLK